MVCSTLSEILKSCDNNMGGITSLLLNDMDNLGTLVVDTNAWEVTSFGTLVDEFVAFEFNRNTGNVVGSKPTDLIAGSTYYMYTATIVLHRREAAKAKAIKILGEGQRDLALVFGDANGLYWYIPNAQLTEVADETGTAKADGSKYTLTFVAELEAPIYEVDSAIIAGLTTPIS
jgi:hypothetical protein